MPNSKADLIVSEERRILNEIAFKISNEAIVNQIIEDRIMSENPAYFKEDLFHCECDNTNCNELINLSLEEYTRSHTLLMRFIVVPQHISLDIEKVIEAFSNYVIVNKFFPDMAPKIAGQSA